MKKIREMVKEWKQEAKQSQQKVKLPTSTYPSCASVPN
jgi:hypothetical protein